MNYFAHRKIHFAEIGKIYFWTATINGWKHLLGKSEFKNVIIESLSFLSLKKLIDVYAFVLMPNHVHLIWRMNSLNGKEKPFGSFLKFTSHEFKKKLNEKELSFFRVEANNKKHEFWQKKPMAIELYSPKVAYQKLDYIHGNPLAKGWNLAKEPSEYLYSSASFYELGKSQFTFLKHIGEEF